MDEHKSDGPSRRQRNQIQKVIDFFDAFNKRDLKSIYNLLAEKHVDRTFFGHQPIDREATIRCFIAFSEAFPDWTETIDEVVASETNKLAVRHTGRGTQAKHFMGREPTGKQVAATYTDILTFDEDDRIVEYNCGQFPFTSFWEEGAAGAEHVMETRAEQGGTMINNAARARIYASFRDGTLDKASAARVDSNDQINRCQALLETNLRRCFNQAAPGSIYCELHSQSGSGYGPASHLLSRAR